MSLSVNTPLEAHHSPVVRRLGNSVLLNEKEIEYLEELQCNTAELTKGDMLVRDGEEFRFCYVVRSGWFMRSRITVKGERQITNLYLPGDFIGLQVNFHRMAAFDITAMNKTEIALIEPMRLLDIYRNHPVLASGLDWSTVRTLNIVSERTVSLGARDASARVLHLYLELWCRLLLVGEADDDGFHMVMNQSEIADTCGLSVVYTNKSIAKLKKAGLIEIDGKRVTIPNAERAFEEADFDARFLEEFRLRPSNHSGRQPLVLDQ